MTAETVVCSKNYGNKVPPTIAIHETNQPLLKARAAIEFIEKWGMVAGIEDGEDSSGRSKLRLATPKEVVERAIEITTLMFNAFDDLEWMHSLPTVEEAEKLIKLKKSEDDSLLKDLRTARDAIIEKTE